MILASAEVMRPFHRWKRRRAAIAKVPALSDLQGAYIWYLKEFNLTQFQAWVNDETISALENMGIIESHERTDPYYRRFTIHPTIWKQLPEPPDQRTRDWLRKKYAESPPWDPSRHTGRI